MSIKDLPHVTVEQVLALRKAAIELEQEATAYRISLENLESENEKLKKELEEVKYCAEWNQHDLGLASEYKKSLDDLKASQPKIKADAVNGYHQELMAATKVIFHPHFEGVKAVYFNKLEAGE